MVSFNDDALENRSAIVALKSIFAGRIITPLDDEYDTARRVWNGAINHRPALIARCASAEDVQAAIRVAGRHGLPLSVLGGGYDWAGRSIRQQGIVIDLTAMRKVSVDPVARTATVQGGATAADVLAVAEMHGLAAVTGVIGNIGMVGFTTAGGYGPLSPHYGLGLDNLLEAELVLADGTYLRVNAAENPDLFWALRGGGGNFGVVTAMTIRLHPVRQVLAGKILFPWSEARSVLTGFKEIMATAPDALALTAVLACGPDGSPGIVLAPCWSGEMDQGAAVMAELQSFGSPLRTDIVPMPCRTLFSLFEPSAPAGRRYAQQTRWLPQMTDATITTLLDIGNGTSPRRISQFSVTALQSFHGAPSRVPAEATAFGLRTPHVLASIVAAWESRASEDSKEYDVLNRHWAREVSEALAQHALPGGYPNLLGPDENVQIDAAYGSNASRLADLKRLFDSNGMFTATPLPAVAATA